MCFLMFYKLYQYIILIPASDLYIMLLFIKNPTTTSVYFYGWVFNKKLDQNHKFLSYFLLRYEFLSFYTDLKDNNET